MIQSHKIIIFWDEIDSLLPAMVKPKDENGSSEHGLSDESGFKGFERFLALLRGLAQETKRLVLVVTSVNADINRTPRREIGTGRDNPMWQGFVALF